MKERKCLQRLKKDRCKEGERERREEGGGKEGIGARRALKPTPLAARCFLFSFECSTKVCGSLCYRGLAIRARSIRKRAPLSYFSRSRRALLFTGETWPVSRSRMIERRNVVRIPLRAGNIEFVFLLLRSVVIYRSGSLKYAAILPLDGNLLLNNRSRANYTVRVDVGA